MTGDLEQRLARAEFFVKKLVEEFLPPVLGRLSSLEEKVKLLNERMSEYVMPDAPQPVPTVPRKRAPMTYDKYQQLLALVDKGNSLKRSAEALGIPYASAHKALHMTAEQVEKLRKQSVKVEAVAAYETAQQVSPTDAPAVAPAPEAAETPAVQPVSSAAYIPPDDPAHLLDTHLGPEFTVFRVPCGDAFAPYDNQGWLRWDQVFRLRAAEWVTPDGYPKNAPCGRNDIVRVMYKNEMVSEPMQAKDVDWTEMGAVMNFRLLEPHK